MSHARPPQTRREAQARRDTQVSDAGAHGHVHGPVPPSTPRVRLILAAFLIPVLLATLVGLVALWPSEDDLPERVPSLAGGTTVVAGEITGPADVESGTVPVALDDGRSVEVTAPPEYIELGFEAGDRVRLLDVGQQGGVDVGFVFLDFERGFPLALLAVLFVVLVALVARWRGLAAVVGLGIALGVVAMFTLPALLAGKHSLGVALVSAFVVMFVVLYIAHGFTARTSTALVGTVLGLLLTAGLATWGTYAAELSGLSHDETLYLPSYAPAVDLHGIMLCGIVLAGLGVLNDVTITQASTVWELRAVAPTAKRRELFSRAMRIGQDHIASAVYTIAFAYVGAALPMLMFVWLTQQDLAASLTGGVIAEEVARTLIGSIGLVLAIPLTTAIAAMTVPGIDTTDTSEDSTRDDVDGAPEDAALVRADDGAWESRP